MEVWTKGNQRQYIHEGVITGYVGAEEDISNITTENGWTNTGEPESYINDVTVGNDEFALNKYLALIAAGLGHLDAVQLSGYNP